jgi:cytochrome c oxidase assembly protein subunit 15
VPAYFRPAVFAAIGYIYLLVYLGAYVRHSGAALACGGWPLCAGQVFPGFSGPAGVEFMHRLAAVLGTLVIAGLTGWTARYRRERPDLFRAAHLALLLIVVQSLSGALVVWTHLDLFSALSHAAIVTLLFGSLCALAYQTVPLQRARMGESRERPAVLGVMPLDD